MELAQKLLGFEVYRKQRYYGSSDGQIEEFVKNLNESSTTIMSLDSAVLGVYKASYFVSQRTRKSRQKSKLAGSL